MALDGTDLLIAAARGRRAPNGRRVAGAHDQGQLRHTRSRAGRFEGLFAARWIWRTSSEVGVEAESPVTWARVTTLAQFDGWERAWRGDESETAGILLPSLLTEPRVEVLVGSQHGVASPVRS